MAKKPVQAKSSAVITVQPTKPSRAKEVVKTPRPAASTKAEAASKSDQVLILLRRSGGATLDELMNATQWQSHSVRGFLSGAIRKRMGLTLVSELSDQGLRRYRITGEAGT